MEGVETPSAASVAAVITVMLWTLMKGIVLVSSTDIYHLFKVFIRQKYETTADSSF